MKRFIFLACLSIISFYSTADNLEKEKKALIETIKSNYESWLLKQDTYSALDTSENLNMAYLAASSSGDFLYTDTVRKEYHFSDFSFKICNCQAVVQFQVDQKTISAFMEKKNGQWKLICAATIPPEL